MINSVFILSHQDDEIGIFELLRLAIEKGENVHILYMTSGSIINEIPKNRIFHRDKESLNVLKNFSMKYKNIIFFGRIHNIPTCVLYKKMNLAYKELLKFLKNLDGEIKVYTHAWEGGNEDHDACNILVKKILCSLTKIKRAYQFPLYNADTSLFYYQVQVALKKNGKIIKIKNSFFNRLKYIKYLFSYKSQLRVWIGLYPFIIPNYLFKNYSVIQILSKNLNFKRPHVGKLLYEKFARCTYRDFKKNINKFLKEN